MAAEALLSVHAATLHLRQLLCAQAQSSADDSKHARAKEMGLAHLLQLQQPLLALDHAAKLSHLPLQLVLLLVQLITTRLLLLQQDRQQDGTQRTGNKHTVSPVQTSMFCLWFCKATDAYTGGSVLHDPSDLQ